MPNMQIWEVKVDGATSHYFVSEAEADFFYRDRVRDGLAVRKQPIPVPQTPKAFVMFLEQFGTQGVCDEHVV